MIENTLKTSSPSHSFQSSVFSVFFPPLGLYQTIFPFQLWHPATLLFIPPAVWLFVFLSAVLLSPGSLSSFVNKIIHSWALSISGRSSLNSQSRSNSLLYSDNYLFPLLQELILFIFCIYQCDYFTVCPLL